jgi:DNA replication and repair protein RecF
MTITRLSLTNFRCYADAVITPGPGFNILTGENGAGKTNVLEAVSLLTPGRGLRGVALGEIRRQNGPGGFGVAAQLGEIELGTGTLATAPDRRIVRINGATHAATALSEWLSVIWLTPAMDRLFSDSASERRRFLDRLVLALDPAHARHSSRYDAAMRQRNRLLAGEEQPDPDWLSALEEQMALHGGAIAQARAELITLLSEQIDKTPDDPFAKAVLAIEGWQDDGFLIQQLAHGRARDASAGRTLVGPHRADLVVTHLAKQQPAANCSTGEQKALLLGIILAHAELVARRNGRQPVLLLDEVAAHLDHVRRAALFARLASSGGQVWMTGTEPQLFAAIGPDAKRFYVEDAKIVAD